MEFFFKRKLLKSFVWTSRNHKFRKSALLNRGWYLKQYEILNGCFQSNSFLSKAQSKLLAAFNNKIDLLIIPPKFNDNGSWVHFLVTVLGYEQSTENQQFDVGIYSWGKSHVLCMAVLIQLLVNEFKPGDDIEVSWYVLTNLSQIYFAYKMKFLFI